MIFITGQAPGYSPVSRIKIILLIDPITAIIGIILLFPVNFEFRNENKKDRKISILEKLINGFQILYGYKYIFRKAIISSVSNLTLTPAIAFLPLLVSQYYDGGPQLLALLQTSAGIGIGIGGLLMSSWSGFKRRAMTLLTADCLLGASLLSGGVAAVFGKPLFLAIPLFATGLFLAVSNTVSAAISQAEVSQNDIGKVNGASSSLSQLMIPIGLTIAIPITNLIGLIGWYISGGILNVLIALFFLFDRGFMNYSLRNSELFGSDNGDFQ